MNKGIFLLLGSNLGDRLSVLGKARMLIESMAGLIEETSSIYQTAAWGNTQQPDFYNQALKIQSALDPEALLATLLSIEKQLGRTRSAHWAPRTIDIDILFYGDRVLQSEALTVPHPQLQNRRFALLPMLELDADLIHPVLRKTIRELAAECGDTLSVRKPDL